MIRLVSQVTVKLKPIDGNDRYTETIKHILKWMDRRAGLKLPEEAWRGKSFELSDIGAQRTAAVAISNYWAARLDDADKNVPQRTWVTEIGVGLDNEGNVLLGTRLVAVTRGSTEQPFDRTIPSFVRIILSEGFAELDGVPLSTQQQVISTREDVEKLVDLLESPNRNSDVLVISLPENSENPLDAVVNAKSIHEKTLGSAHVFVLTGAASFHLTNLVGRELSVFKRGVRTYRRGFKSWVDEPSNHPLALAERVLERVDNDPTSFERWLINQILGNSVYGIGREERLPSFNSVRQLAAQFERKKLQDAGGTDSDLLKLFEQDNEQLRKELQEQKDQYDGLLSAADSERELALQEAHAAQALASARLHRVRQLEQKLANLEMQVETPIPDTLDGFDEWCETYLGSSVELANRAFQGVRKSEYHDPKLLYGALLLLRDYYTPMRVEGTPERRQAYEKALQELQLEDSGTGDGVKFAADTYSVQYGGRRRSLDRHLKSGDARDRRYCFRLYFFWDDENKIVVVGWLPSHLDNRSS